MLLSTRLSSPSDPTSVASSLNISSAAWRRLLTYVSHSPAEINGFAYVQNTPSGFTIMDPDDVFITEQQVTMGSADVSGSTYAKAYDRAVRVGRGDELRLQWHSHVDGAAYLSPKDMRTIENYGMAGSDWMLSLVTNKRGEVCARADQFSPFRTGCEMTVLIVDSISEEERVSTLEHVNELVKVIIPPPAKDKFRPRY
ncbi:MAG: hypothetical protein ACOH18_03855 [Candidatus Saccharimonadaceae bacterium]